MSEKRTRTEAAAAAQETYNRVIDAMGAVELLQKIRNHEFGEHSCYLEDFEYVCIEAAWAKLDNIGGTMRVFTDYFRDADEGENEE